MFSRFRCAPANFSDPNYQVINNILTFLVIFLPMLVLLSSNLSILFIVTKFRIKREIAVSTYSSFCDYFVGRVFKRKKQRLGVPCPASGNTALTISLICCVFIASYTPLIVFIALRSQNYAIPGWYHIFFTHSLSLNIIFNPFIYALTNKRFRGFVAEKFMINSSVS